MISSYSFLCLILKAELYHCRIDASYFNNIGLAIGFKALTFDDATPEHVRSAIGQGVAVLHLATHAVFYKDAPLDSALFLAGDGMVYALTAADLFDSPLRADLVVLSACETGIGESQGDSDFLGLSRSFYLGGSRAILNTLWSVDDEGTNLDYS